MNTEQKGGVGLPVATESSIKMTMHYHECPECGDPTDEYIHSMVGLEIECSYCDIKYIVGANHDPEA